MLQSIRPLLVVVAPPSPTLAALVAALVLPLLVVDSGCATPRLDKPSSGVSSGPEVGVRFAIDDVTLRAPGYVEDVAARSYIADALNRSTGSNDAGTPVKTEVTLLPEAAIFSGTETATVTTKLPSGDAVTTKESGTVGSPALAGLGFATLGISAMAAAVGAAIALPAPGPGLALSACGLLGMGCGFGLRGIGNIGVEEQTSDVVAHAIRSHAEDLRRRRAEIAPPPPNPAMSTASSSGTALPPLPQVPQVPQVPPPPANGGSGGVAWSASLDGAGVTTLDAAQLAAAIDDGRIEGSTLVWRAGMPAWVAAKDVRELEPLLKRATQWFATVDGKQTGPLTRSQLAAAIGAGRVTRTSLVWRTGMASWTQASDVPDVAAMFPSNSSATPPPLPPTMRH